MGPPPESASWSLPSWPSPRDAGRWFEQTAWWNTPTFARSPERALVELVEAVAGRFTGRELTLNVRAHAVRLRVAAVRVRERAVPSAVEDPLRWWAETSGMNEFVRWSRRVVGLDDADDAAPVDALVLDATDVHLDGLPVGRVAVQVDGMRLEPGLPLPTLVTGPIEFDVHTTREQIIDWVRREVPAWGIEPRPDGFIALRMPRRRVRVLVRATPSASGLRIDTVGVLVFRRELRFPRRLIRTRVHTLPPLDPALEIVGVTVDGDDVSLRVRHEGIRQPLRLDALRTAIRDGATKLTDTILG